MPRTFLRITVFVALFLIAQTIPVGAVAVSSIGPIPGGLDGNQPAASQNPGQPDTPKRIKDPKPYRGTAEWDPRDPAAVQYADGAWGVAYNDNANPPNLFFRRTLGGDDPEYWRDAVTVEAGAERPAMTRLGSSTALFYGKLVGTVREVFVKTSTDDGATWWLPRS